MVVDLPISESSAYKAGPTIDKGYYKEKETNKDKRSVKLENVGEEDIPDYKNTGKRKIDQEENNNKGETSFAISSAHSTVLENKDKFAVSDKSKISKVKSDKLLLIKETSICISSSHHNTNNISKPKEKIDLKTKVEGEKLSDTIHKSNDQNKDTLNDSMKNHSQTNNHEKINERTLDGNANNVNKSVAPGKNCNAPLFIPSKYLSTTRPPPTNTVYAMKEPCIYYPAYPSYYDSSNPISYNYSRNNSINVENLNEESAEKGFKNSPLNKEKDKSIEHVDIVKESNEPAKHCTNDKEDKSSSVEQLSVIEEPNNGPPEDHYTKITPLKEEASKMGDASVESFTPSQYESQNSENNGNPEVQDSYSLQNTDEPSPFIASHPVLSPITGNHGDLFINPALAHAAHASLQAHGLIHPDPPSFMSFLPDGSLVSPMGEMYCPPPDYFIMDQNGDMPPGLVSPSHSNNFDGKY